MGNVSNIGLNFNKWVTLGYSVGKMSLEVYVDERGRITIPKEVREKLRLKPRDKLLIRVEGDAIIITRSKDPYKIIENILKDLSFDRRLRKKAEEEIVKELKARHVK